MTRAFAPLTWCGSMYRISTRPAALCKSCTCFYSCDGPSVIFLASHFRVAAYVQCRPNLGPLSRTALHYTTYTATIARHAPPSFIWPDSNLPSQHCILKKQPVSSKMMSREDIGPPPIRLHYSTILYCIHLDVKPSPDRRREGTRLRQLPPANQSAPSSVRWHPPEHA